MSKSEILRLTSRVVVTGLFATGAFVAHNFSNTNVERANSDAQKKAPLTRAIPIMNEAIAIAAEAPSTANDPLAFLTGQTMSPQVDPRPVVVSGKLQDAQSILTSSEDRKKVGDLVSQASKGIHVETVRAMLDQSMTFTDSLSALTIDQNEAILKARLAKFGAELSAGAGLAGVTSTLFIRKRKPGTEPVRAKVAAV